MTKNARRIDRRSAFLGGLVAALIVSAVPAIADVGDALLAGKFNAVDRKTAISGTAAGDSMLKIANTAAVGGGVTIQVESGNPPLVVNTAKRVKRLNADKVDGHDASEFVLDGGLGVFAAAQIRADATIRNSTDRVLAVTSPTTGAYCIEFSEPIAQNRLESAVVGLAGGSIQVAFPRIVNGQAAATACPGGTLHVEVTDVDRSLVDARFSIIVP